jgi:hypothetical protein
VAGEDPGPPAPAGAGQRREVDRAALLGTALAAVVALTFGGEGAWDGLAAVTGLALLALLAAFFRLPAGPRRGAAPHLELAALAGVVALSATLVVAPPLQSVLSATEPGRTGRVAAAVAAGTREGDPAHRAGAQVAVGGPADGPAVRAALSRAGAEERDAVLGVCLGSLTSRWLWVPAVVVAAAVFAVTGRRVRRGAGR